MKCNSLFEEATEWWLRLRESNVAPETIAEWMNWCDASPENLAAFESVQALWRKAGAATIKPVSYDLPERGRPGRRLILWACAASLTALASGALYQLVLVDGRSPDSVPAVHERAATKVGETADLVLPDGSRAKLGGASRIMTAFTTERRIVKLEHGEAFFAVEKDANRPFVVLTSSAAITALGTAFNVRTDGGQLKVTVTEGLVQVGRKDGAETAHATVRLQAGDQAVIDKTASQRETISIVRAVDAAMAVSWTTGALKFMDEPLSSVVATVNRYSSKTVMLQREEAEGLRFTGTVVTDRIDEWLAALPNAFPVEVVVDGPDRLRIEVRGE